MMPTSDAKVKSRRATGIWNFGGESKKQSLAIEPPTAASGSALNYDHVDGSFEFGGIRVKLVTYKSIPGVIQINASKTISEWNTLRTLNHINIVGFDDNSPSVSHWLPINADDPDGDPKGRCELYISKPPLSVTVAAARAQYPWSVLDAHRMCQDILNALNFLAGHGLSRGDFTTEHVLVTGEGFKLANIHLCEVVKGNAIVRDLFSVGKILDEVLIGNHVPEPVEWNNFYTAVTREVDFKAYLDLLPRVLSEHWPKSSREYETTSQDDRLRGIAYLVSQRQLNTFQW